MILAAFAQQLNEPDAETIAAWALASAARLNDPLEQVDSWVKSQSRYLWTPYGRAALFKSWEALRDRLPEGTGAVAEQKPEATESDVPDEDVTDDK